MEIFNTCDPTFIQVWSNFLRRSTEGDPSVEETVREIIANVRNQGDQAVLEYTERFDKHRPASIELSRQEIEAAVKQVKPEVMKSLRLAAARIQAFHKQQLKKSSAPWSSRSEGASLGERVSPMDRIGIYVPGGLAAYPSTVLMNTIPARIAGVKEIVMVSPWRSGLWDPHTLAAAKLAGVTRIFKVGGAQAVAALAYGTETIPAVDKIVGPGNAYVAAAKRLVFGKVGIDMIAGPTEIAVIADAHADPEHVAADLLSQAEHDPLAVPVLMTPSKKLVQAVHDELERQLQNLPRREIIRQAIDGQGAVVLTRTIAEAIDLSNQFAPEHLSLQVRNPKKILSRIRNAGAVFLGPWSPVAFGDYLAGPNHVLPTSGTARFSSPLGVADFLKRTSVLEFDRKSFERLAPHVMQLARLEGLTAHAASVSVRVAKKN